MSERLKVLFVGGYPFAGMPHRNIFNQRGVQQLAAYNDMTVLNIRMWAPGRKLKAEWQDGDVRVIQLCLPQFKKLNTANHTLNFNLVSAQVSLLLNNLIKNTDVIHSAGAAYAGILAGLLARKYKKPHVAQLIGSDINDEFPHYAATHLVKTFPSLTTAVRANCIELRNTYTEFFKLPRTAADIVYRGIDTGKFKELERLPAEEGIRFLYIGGLPPDTANSPERNSKGGWTLMQAWKKQEALLNERNAFLTFGGPYSDHEVFHKWKETLKYPGRVELAGVLKPEQVLEQYKRSLVVIIPSLKEGLPNVGMEAAASGRALIGSKTGGIPEVIVNGESGLTFEKGSVEGLEECLIKMTRDKAEVIEMGKRGRAYIVSAFDHRQFATKYTQLYKELVAKR